MPLARTNSSGYCGWFRQRTVPISVSPTILKFLESEDTNSGFCTGWYKHTGARQVHSTFEDRRGQFLPPHVNIRQPPNKSNLGETLDAVDNWGSHFVTLNRKFWGNFAPVKTYFAHAQGTTHSPFSENLNRVAGKLFCAVGMNSFFNSLHFFWQNGTSFEPTHLWNQRHASLNAWLPVIGVFPECLAILEIQHSR